MSKVAVEHLFRGETVEYPAYDSTKTRLGKLISQFNLGALDDQKYAGPLPVVVGRPMEASTAIPCAYPCTVDIGDGQQYVFFADNAAAAATRRVVMYKYDKNLGTFSWQGYITITFPTATNFTIRGFRMVRYTNSTGTVGVSGTAVTGSGTNWKTEGMAAGSRIGFGSTDPAQITTWYQIAPGSAIASDTAITLATSAGTIAADTPFVIEDWRAVIAATNATTTNGGLFVVKGLSPQAFIPTGTAVAAATTVDNIRACYWLADASTVTNITACGVCVGPSPVDATTHYCYVLDSSGGVKIYKYNMRKALTLSSGKDTTCLVLATGSQTVTGTISTNNNGRYGTLNHGPGAGVASIYFVTTTRIYRVAAANIVSASTTFISDVMTEVPPGGTVSYPASGALSSIEFSDSIDRLIITTTGATAFRQYVTQYRTDGGQMDHFFGLDNKQIDQGSMHPDIPLRMVSGGQVSSAWVEAGVLYFCQNGILATTNIVHIAPLAAHWTYASTTHNRLISPEISLPGCTKLTRLYVNEVQLLGGVELGTSPEPYRVLARTSGISDNSGTWTAVTPNGDISGFAVTGSIQFAFEFKVLGDACIPARIMGFTVVYESGDVLPSSHQWNFDDSDPDTGIIGFIQKTTMGSVPVLKIDYYRNDTDALVLSQTSASTTNGVFEYHNGSTWTAGVGTDTVGLRRRFRPTAGLPAGIAVYPKISVV